MNKQKGEKRHHAYLASLVAMIAEKVLGPNGFMDDARQLSVLTQNNILEGVFSRRFDGAIPDTKNPPRSLGNKRILRHYHVRKSRRRWGL